jgi:hypothetical protein
MNTIEKPKAKSKKQVWIVVDVEADGPCPGLYSMIQVGAVAILGGKFEKFGAKFCPLDGAAFQQEALNVVGVTREETLAYTKTQHAMEDFRNWLRIIELKAYDERFDVRLVFVSDNLAFDWQFVNYYFHKYFGGNPFGHSGRRIGDLWSGFNNDYRKGSEWKGFRVTRHTHDPVDDATGNAEALLHMASVGLKLPV